ncbi:hypothetical protein D8674_028725 [Pyrus ussuriensis x Pyrus communis]|uniref:Uncharacterized protein n=1 Tax=Pyrus ussuriensis x Pyrus communis TaxID=2448454 RepID=A0A5N5HY27_9ROSA|nr:hypothetical protein D8674_028725 [Pyrus ussuriensis x Pyrus communis]
MLQLIRSRKAVTTTPRPISSPSILAAIAPADIEPISVNPVDAADVVAPQSSQTPVSSTSSVTLPVSASRGHCRPRMHDTTQYRHPLLMPRVPNQHSALANDSGHVVRTSCLMQWKSWKAMSWKVMEVLEGDAQLSMNYSFDDINDDMLVYVDRLFAERYKQWKSNLHQYFETFDDSQVALEEGCPKKFEAWEDS